MTNIDIYKVKKVFPGKSFLGEEFYSKSHRRCLGTFPAIASNTDEPILSHFDFYTCDEKNLENQSIKCPLVMKS